MKGIEKFILGLVLVVILGALALGATALVKNWDKVFPEDTNVSTQTPNEDGDTEEELTPIEYLTAERYYYYSRSGEYMELFSFKFNGDSFDNLTLDILCDSREYENLEVRVSDYEGTKKLLTASISRTDDFELLYNPETKELCKSPLLDSVASDYKEYLNYITRYSDAPTA